jgi:hypothetical protein
LIDRKCETCDCWVKVGDNKGFCHRWPPIPYPMMQGQVIGSANVGQISMFPIIGKGDFCAEWRNNGD